MKVLLKTNVLYNGQRLLAGTYADLPDAETLIANGYAEAVEVAPAEAPPLAEEAKAAEEKTEAEAEAEAEAEEDAKAAAKKPAAKKAGAK